MGPAERFSDAARVALEVARGHPRHLVLAAVVAGLLAAPAPVAVVLACVAAGAAVGGGRWTVHRARLLALLAVGAVLAGALFAQARLAALERTALGPFLGHDVTIRGFVLEHPRAPAGRLPAAVSGPPWAPGTGGGSRGGGRSALVLVTAGPGAGERVSVRASRWPAVAPGEEVVAEGPLRALGARDGWLRRRGAHGRLRARTVWATGGRRGGVAGRLDRLRASAERAVSSGLDPPRAALARGMVLGQDEALDEDMREAFRVSGLAHLLAASGQNVMLLAALALPVLAALGLGLRGRLAGVLGLIALYVPLAGAGPSIQRAGVMGAAGIVAVLAGRPASRWYALLLAAAVTLGIDPRAAQDPGWQLSFAAVVAILLLAAPLAARLRERRVPRAVAEAAALTAAATVGTAPLLAFHFERVSLVSLPANLLAVAAVAPAMWLGMLAVAAGAVAPGLAQLPNALASYPLAYLGRLAESAAALPHASVPVQLHSPLALATTYVILGAAVVLVLRRRPISPAAARPGRLARAVAALRGDGAVPPRPGGPLRAARRALVAVAVAVGVVAFLEGRRLPPPPDARDVVVSFLDIGQGDATLVQYGGATLLVDTGPPGSPLLQRLREAGVRRVDLLVLTHSQADHDGGAADVLSRIPVGHVLDGGEQLTRLHRLALNAATARHVPRSTPDAGQTIHAGPLELRILWPRREPPADHPGVDPNDRAIVAHLRAGAFDLLLPADAESNVTAALDLPPVEALKVAHHGSEDAGTPDLIARLRPRIAAIEVGRGNTYGHPTPGLLTALRPVPAVYRTDRDGTVRLTVHAGRMSVTTAR
jgi:competence protein ComEC